MHGFCADHLKWKGRPSVPGRKIAQVKRLMNNKERRSIRSVSKRVGVSLTSVVRIMKKYGYKAYHKYKVQKMSDDHKEWRVECARMFLSVYGRRVIEEWQKVGKDHQYWFQCQNHYLWPIENVWSILKGKVPEKECSNDQQLKKAIITAWREIDDDKALCRHLMASLPHRLQDVIRKEGRQIQKEDY